MFTFPQQTPAAIPPTMLFPGVGGIAPAGAVVPGTELPTNQPISGKIKAWYEDKSFGFVTPDLPAPDIFVHKNQLTDAVQLAPGTPVSFQCRYNPARGKYECTTCQSAGVAPDAGAASSGDKGNVPANGGWAVQDNLFIAGLPMTTTEEFVRELFGRYGSVAQCKLLPDQPGKQDKAVLVRFAEASKARWCVENLNGTAPEGLSAPLTVRFAGDRPGGLAASAGKSVTAFGPAGVAAAPLGHQLSPYGVASPVVLPTGADPLTSALTQLIPGLMQPQLLQGLQAQGLQALGALGQGSLGLGNLASLGYLGAAGATEPGVGAMQTAVTMPGMLQLGVDSTSPVASLPTTPSAGLPIGGGDGLSSTAPGADGSNVVIAASTDAPATSQPFGDQSSVAQTAIAGVVQSPTATVDMWLQATDPASGRPYYYHALTREVRWDKPVV